MSKTALERSGASNCSLRLLRLEVVMGETQDDDDDCEPMSAIHTEAFRVMSGCDPPIGTRAVEWENGGVSFVLGDVLPGSPLFEQRKTQTVRIVSGLRLSFDANGGLLPQAPVHQ